MNTINHFNKMPLIILKPNLIKIEFNKKNSIVSNLMPLLIFTLEASVLISSPYIILRLGRLG